MSHFNPGLISAYNSLTDRHLTGYFSNTRIRRHLQRAGLITRSGRIVPDKEYRHKLIQRAHQRHVRECLAQAIFHKVLEMERLHQIEIKKKLEEFARRERVHKIKVERSRRYEEEIVRILSPRPPTGARGIRKQHSGPEEEHSESSESPGSSRPNTAPGKMQRPVRLKPIHNNSTAASHRRSSPYRHLESSNDNNQPFNCTMDKESGRRFTTVEAASHGISPYCLPVINNFVTPVPPATKRKERGAKVTPSSTLRGRRLRPTTASSGADIRAPMLRSSVHQSKVCVNMVYFGKTVHLSHDLTDMRDEVKVFQQHCGGENLCVFKGKLREGESFQFISRRHRGFPFSLTFFLNGLQVERLSSCCEFKHRKGSRLGGRHGHFGFSSVEGASPCYKCIIAMGLDKKPTPPPKRVKEERGREEVVTNSKDTPEMEMERTGEDAASHLAFERSQRQDTETQVKEETAAEEDKVRDDYEEDFEADDEGPVEEAKENNPPSPISETKTQFKERDASETEDDEKDEDIKSRSGSSCSDSNGEASDAEATQDHGTRDNEKTEQPEEVDLEETVAPPGEKDEPKPEEAAPTEADSAVAKDSDLQDNVGDSTEIDIPDSSVPSGSEIKESDDTSAEKEAEKTVDEGKQEQEGQERAKYVQEKLAEAMLKESHCSSEPELSDTSTEEEVEATGNNDLVPDKPVAFTELQRTLREETKDEESVCVGEAEVVQDHKEISEPKEEDNESEKVPDSNDSTKEDMVKMDEDEGNRAPEEDAAEEAAEDAAEDAALHPVSEEAMTEESRTSEPQKDAAAESTNAPVAQKDEGREEKAGEVEEMQPIESGQGPKSREEDESLASEPNKKTDETVVSDNTEAEEAMTASETMEMKAGPSEEGEALGCEEAPVSDAEEKQQADSKDTGKAPETEATAENSSCSAEKTASEDNEKDSKDDMKEGDAEEVTAAEEVAAAEESEDGMKQERLGEEQTEKSVCEVEDGVEKEKGEEESKEEAKQTNPDEPPECENREQQEKNESDKTGDVESKTEDRVENDEVIVEDSKTDSNTNEGPTEKTFDGEDKAMNEKRVDECKRTEEKEEDEECVENKHDEEESEAKGAINNESEEIKETTTDADEERGDEAEKEEDEDENGAKQSESEKNKDIKESEEKEIMTCKTGEGEEIVITGEPEINANDVKISDENTAQSEGVLKGEAAEEMLNNVMESEDGNITGREKGEIDAENGEISTRAESKSLEDETEALTEEQHSVKAADIDEEDLNTEEKPTEEESSEVKEATVESGGDKVDEGPDTDTVESEAKNEDDGLEKQDESAQRDSEEDIAGTEMKEESKPDDLNTDGDGHEENKDGSDNKPDLDNDNRDSDSSRINDNNVNEAIAVSSAAQPQSSTPTDLALGETTSTTQPIDESIIASEEQPHADESAVATDLPAADGKNGSDTEEASKASEEGASVLLKPQAQNNEDGNAEESVAASEATPEALATDDNTDLVTNWVTMHQTSKFFETFVEPLEELTEEASHTQVSTSSEGAAKSTEPPRPESPLKMKMSESEEGGQMERDENEAKEMNEERTVELDLESEQAEDGEPRKNNSTKDTVQEETEVQDLILKTATNESKDQQRTGSRGSLQEDIDQAGPSQMLDDTTKTEVESIAGTLHSVASGKPENVTEKKTGEETADNDPELNKKQTATDEIEDLLPSSKTEEHHGHSASPDGPRDTEETQGRDEQSGEVTEITDFTGSKSEDGSQEESQDGEIQPKPSDGGINGEKKDVDLIQDIKHTLSKDRLSTFSSTFSVDETLFGRSSYPLLTAARTESGH